MDTATHPAAAAATAPRTPTRRDADRRRGDRHRLSIPATLLTDDGAAAVTVAITVTAVSVNGVGLRSPVLLRDGAVYVLTAFDSLLPPGTRVRVVSQRPAEDGAGGFDVGTATVDDGPH